MQLLGRASSPLFFNVIRAGGQAARVPMCRRVAKVVNIHRRARCDCCSTAMCLSFQICRPAVSSCDLAETCNGLSGDCPLDLYQKSAMTAAAQKRCIALLGGNRPGVACTDGTCYRGRCLLNPNAVCQVPRCWRIQHLACRAKACSVSVRGDPSTAQLLFGPHLSGHSKLLPPV